MNTFIHGNFFYVLFCHCQNETFLFNSIPHKTKLLIYFYRFFFFFQKWHENNWKSASKSYKFCIIDLIIQNRRVHCIVIVIFGKYEQFSIALTYIMVKWCSKCFDIVKIAIFIYCRKLYGGNLYETKRIRWM